MIFSIADCSAVYTLHVMAQGDRAIRAHSVAPVASANVTTMNGDSNTRNDTHADLNVTEDGDEGECGGDEDGGLKFVVDEGLM